MINHLNLKIEQFLDGNIEFDENDAELIKNKFKTEITDDLKKGHITTNVGLISGSILDKNPREIAEKFKNLLLEIKGINKIGKSIEYNVRFLISSTLLAESNRADPV